ncbi:MAG: type II secretion system protein [Planctomycetota bacterium]|jgi:hypothetical protein
MRLNNGFTRVDLLVTFLCATFLVGTLGAIGNRGRRRAQQLVCASQLGKWGAAIAAYNADNDNIPTIMCREWGLFPAFMGWVPPGEFASGWAPEGATPGEWSVWKMNPYIECVDENFIENGKASRILACPNYNGDFMVDLIYEQWKNWPYEYFFIFTSYSYWGGAADAIDISDAFPNEYSADALSDLTLDTLSPRRLLMSDSLYLDSGIAWNYNHGAQSQACSFEYLVSTIPQINVKYDGEQDATGRNQLFGDGRVQWRPISLEFEDNLPSMFDVGFKEDEWNGPGSGYISTSGGYDFSYY